VIDKGNICSSFGESGNNVLADTPRSSSDDGSLASQRELRQHRGVDVFWEIERHADLFFFFNVLSCVMFISHKDTPALK
jgi:hypothetical protein